MTDTQARRCGHCGRSLLATDAVHYPARRGETDAGNPLLGTVIDGKYRLQSVLGRGGLGTVFRAQHIGSLVTVAVKLLHPRFSDRPEYRRALLPEARRAAAVAHERCARVLDVGESDEGIAYLAMELVDGQTLDEALQQGPFAPSHALDILIQVCAALAAIHDAALVHCDLSPRNVMVAAHAGRLDVKVLDFGIARSMSMARRDRAPGDLAGFANPAFSAPELLAGGDVDARADVYALGTLAWLMLTGKMPVDDADTASTIASVREGRLLPWPNPPKVPARLARLVQQCVRFDPAQRPGSARALQRRFEQLRIGNGPRLARLAAAVALLAVVVALFAFEGREPARLAQGQGSPVRWSDRPVAAGDDAVDLRAGSIDRLEFYYAGLDPRRLRAEISQGGRRLNSVELLPQVEPGDGLLLLDTAQDDWRAVVAGVVESSRKGAVDLAFVAPGHGVLAAARVRLDAEAPRVTASMPSLVGGRLLADSRLRLRAVDDIGVESVRVAVAFASGERATFDAPPGAEELALGEELRRRYPTTGDLGAGKVFVVARDRGGNEARSEPIAFRAADVAVPFVEEVAGPTGGMTMTRRGGRISGRVRLSAVERGCRILGRVLPDGAQEFELGAPTSEQRWHAIEFDEEHLGPERDSVHLRVAVVDPAGNRSEREFTPQVLARDLRLTIEPQEQGDAPPVVWDGRELVIGSGGCLLRVGVGALFRLEGAAFDAVGPLARSDAVRVQHLDERHALLQITELAPGRHELVLHVGERGASRSEHRVPVLVLPDAVELVVPATRARFLHGLLAAGLLAERGGELREGATWRWRQRELRAYVGGTLWVGEVPLTVRAGESGPLLPSVAPVVGRNLFALELRDVLQRPVRLADPAGDELPRDASGRYVLCDFWWSSAAPELVEGLVVEHGRPVRFRVRFPLPFSAARGDELLLSVVGTQIAARELARVDELRTDASFEVGFELWSVAANLTKYPREAYVEGHEGTIDATFHTPAGNYALSLPVRTTRSTLAPLRLRELASDLPEALGDVQLLPVLAPDGVFKEPVPPRGVAPPRQAFRPLVAVDVRNMPDVLLQDRELSWQEARALADVAAGLADGALRARCVHAEDPLQEKRLERGNLLPTGAETAAGEAVLAGVDFYQAYALARLLGVAVAGDPDLFRLPLGCELELAAFGEHGGSCCHGVGARGGQIRVDDFLDAGGLLPVTVARSREIGDVVESGYGAFVGLDFGVREWVFDIPNTPGTEPMMHEWLADHAGHLRRVQRIATGRAVEGRDPVWPSRQFGVVRGLAFGEECGLIDAEGRPLPTGRYGTLPPSVPGVLRVEQLHCDGSTWTNPGGAARDPRLAHIGFRVAATAIDLVRRDLAGGGGSR